MCRKLMKWQTLAALGRIIFTTCVCFYGYSAQGLSTIRSTVIKNVGNADQLDLSIPQ